MNRFTEQGQIRVGTSFSDVVQLHAGDQTDHFKFKSNYDMACWERADRCRACETTALPSCVTAQSPFALQVSFMHCMGFMFSAYLGVMHKV